jgi:hypothetical protein
MLLLLWDCCFEANPPYLQPTLKHERGIASSG